ncbi:ATP-dependent DNA ligase LigC [Candidatus Paraburkholderia kirkii]|nr:ATP-dependent DNA ligase LigC [Candidatus Paraburkholderia kirkii]
MKRFATLYAALDATTSTNDKLEALIAYFAGAEPEDAAWASYFLAGGKPRQSVPTRLLTEVARERAGLPEWLFEESYQAVGDLAETIAHVLPPASRESSLGLAQWIEERVLTLRGASPAELRERLLSYWDELDWSERFLLTKLIGGGFRVGVARQLVVRALAEVAGVDHKRIAQRMVGWTDSREKPSAARYLRLVAPAAEGDDVDTPHESDIGLPYPFFLAHPLQADPASLGSLADWIVEWKWDGIRAQLVKRAGRVWIWSRGEDLVTERFPELAALGQAAGWRSTFWVVTLIGVAAAGALAVCLPRHIEMRETSILREFDVLKNPQVLMVLGISVLASASLFSVFTYITPILEDVTGFSPHAVTYVLLLFGLGLTVGSTLGGKLADWKLLRSLLSFLLAIVVILTIFAGTMHEPVAAMVTIFFWGVLAFVIVPPLQILIVNH